MADNRFEEVLNKVNTGSRPSDLRITDMKFVDIEGAPMRCSLMKLETNQGIVGYGEVRDWSYKEYALMLKSRILGENPCDVDRIFRKLKPMGTHSRGGGGVSAIELALWDLAGKAYGVPVYQMLGGRMRDKVRCYADTDIEGKPDGIQMGHALQKRIDMGFTLLKMDLGIDLLYGVPGALSGPAGLVEQIGKDVYAQLKSYEGSIEERYERHKIVAVQEIQHHITGIQITPVGFEWFDQYLKDVRSVIGYDIPIAVDHLGHISFTEAVKLGRLCEKYNIAWMEDAIPWMYTEQIKMLQNSVAVPICTGEDIFGHENFYPLIQNNAVSMLHPDILTTGGILETKKISDYAMEYGIGMCIHMAESPIAAMAAAHVATACENFLAQEYHSVDVPWWNDLVEGPHKPIVDRGFITVDSNAPGLGIDKLNDEVIAEHIYKKVPGMWEDTHSWDTRYVLDRIWS